MRIIAGSARGTRLGVVPGGVRPVSDRAREGLFSSLGAMAPQARVLDLFSGTGALGIEALSRGAERAVLVDASSAAVAAIRANLERTHLADRGAAVRADALSFLRRPGGPDPPADLVFLDPPYDDAGVDLPAVLGELASGWLAPEGWTVVLTRGTRSSTPVIPVDWVVARRLEYGDSLVLVYREARWV